MTVKKCNIKLNPKKYSFGVQSRRFLGYVVDQRGIKDNLKKVYAITDMLFPHTICDVQKLTVCMAMLE